MTTWESLGILVFRGEVSLDLVDDFFSGAVELSWRKSETPPIPAHVEHRGWRPS